MATSTEEGFRRLIKFYLFERPDGEFGSYIVADLITPDKRDWLHRVLAGMVNSGEVLVVDSGRSKANFYRLSATTWLQLTKEEPDHWIETLKKFKLLPLT